MAGKTAAKTCPNCKAGMKRIYVKTDGAFKGIGNGCLRCDKIVWDNESFIDSWSQLRRR